MLTELASITVGRDLTDASSPLAVFDHTLTSDPTTRPIWQWFLLLALLLLPFDIAVRRLVITKRDWERVWASTFGRFASQPVVVAPRPEPMSRLFQAKERASTQSSDEESASANVPPPVMRRDATETTQPSMPRPPAVTRPRSVPKQGGSPASGSLASRLLDKKRQQQQDQQDEV